MWSLLIHVYIWWTQRMSWKKAIRRFCLIYSHIFFVTTIYDQLIYLFTIIGRGHLIYLEFGEEPLVHMKHLLVQFDLSFLDLNLIGDNPYWSELTVIELWNDYSIRLYSLMKFNFLMRFHFTENVPSWSIFLCRFEWIPCLLGGGVKHARSWRHSKYTYNYRIDGVQLHSTLFLYI